MLMPAKAALASVAAFLARLNRPMRPERQPGFGVEFAENVSRFPRVPLHAPEHEHLVEDVQRRLDENPDAMRQRRETVEHPFGTIKARMGATHFLMKRLPNVACEMALHVLAYNLTRVMNIVGRTRLIEAIRAA